MRPRPQTDRPIDRAVHRLSALGHRVASRSTCSTRWHRFSAPDDERLAAILRMSADPGVELAVTARGGYGWSRLLDRIDFVALAQSGKRWMGHSDFTAFQLAALAHAGMTTFAGPMAAYDFGATIPSAFTLDHAAGSPPARGMKSSVRSTARISPATVRCGRQPAMIAHLVGGRRTCRAWTAAFSSRGHRRASVPDRADALPAPPCRRFVRQRAVLLGDFSGYELGPNDNGYDAAAMVAHVRARLDVPVYTGFPFGHCPESSRCRSAAAAHHGSGRPGSARIQRLWSTLILSRPRADALRAGASEGFSARVEQ
jgi:muramoyltetrapeptide carboxypeptidase